MDTICDNNHFSFPLTSVPPTPFLPAVTFSRSRQRYLLTASFCMAVFLKELAQLIVFLLLTRTFGNSLELVFSQFSTDGVATIVSVTTVYAVCASMCSSNVVTFLQLSVSVPVVPSGLCAFFFPSQVIVMRHNYHEIMSMMYIYTLNFSEMIEMHTRQGSTRDLWN